MAKSKHERDHIILWRKINSKLFKEHNDVSSIEAKLIKQDYTTQTTMRHEACTNSPDENRETCKLVRKVPRYHATEAYQVRDMRVDAVIMGGRGEPKANLELPKLN